MGQRPTPLRRWLASGIAVLALLVAVGMWFRVMHRARYALPYSSYGTSEEGARALFMLTEASGFRAERWSHELVGLPPQAVWVVLGGCASRPPPSLTRRERLELQRFLSDGGTLFVAGASDLALEELPFSLTAAERCSAKATGRSPSPTDRASFKDQRMAPDGVHGAEGEGWLEGLGVLTMREAGALEVASGTDATVLLKDEEKLLAVELSIGKGRLLVFASAEWFQNDGLVNEAGAVVFGRFLRTVSRPGPVIFDELYVGAGRRRSIMQYLLSQGAGPPLLQLLAVVGLLLWRKRARFGAPLRQAAAIPGGTRPFLSAMAWHYRRTGEASEALARLKRYALAQVAALHHLDAGTPEALARGFFRKGRPDLARAVGKVAALELEKGDSTGHLLSAAKRLDHLLAPFSSAGRRKNLDRQAKSVWKQSP